MFSLSAASKKLPKSTLYVMLPCLAQKKTESFERSAAKALAMNVPVVASAPGGMPDIVIQS